MGVFTQPLRSGDTLTRIARTFDLSLEQLLAINPQIEDPDLIFAGQAINVPADGTSGTNGGEPPSSTATAEWFRIAQNELGETEIVGPDHNPRIIEYHRTTSLRATNDETPWCSSFVNWCMTESGVTGTNSAAARSWLTWGKKLNQPKRGCIVVYSSSRGPTSGHVGFFDRIQDNHILTLGGNQSNAVNYSSYSRNRLLGYRWPAS